MTLSRDPIERTVHVAKFLRKVDVPLRNPRGCWVWRGVLQPDCVAAFSWAKHYGTTASRYAWLVTYGAPLARGTLLLRTCRNVRCVNPAHGRPYRSKEVALEVRRLLAAGMKQRDVAEKVGIPIGSVGRLAVGVRRKAA
jgi:hypothetical protein